jgi:protein-disulfide isomerase/uncharacterized membrane protein
MSTTPVAAAPTFAQPRPLIRWVAIVVAALGWFISLQLLYASVGVDTALLDAMCKASGGADDCRAVLRSQWAYWGRGDAPSGGVPVAGLGMAYFSFVTLWFVLVGTPTRNRWGWYLVILGAVAIGVFVSANLVFIMATMLHRWCLGCVATHVLNGLLLLLTLAGWPRSGSGGAQLPHPGPRLGPAALLACGAVAVANVLWFAASAGNSRAEKYSAMYTAIMDDPAYIRWNYERQPVLTIPPRDDGTALGRPDAPNTVVLFVDFQCAACKQAHEVVDALVEKYPDRLRVEYRHYPQDPECNPDPRFKSGGHTVACKAARAAEAALVAGGPLAFHEMRRRIYDGQRTLEAEPFAAKAVAAGVGSAQEFDVAWYSPAVAERVRADIDLARSIGVEGVPTVYLNGRRLQSWHKRETWEALAGIPPLTTQPATGSSGS